jgi:hypothetical protein
VSGQFNDLLYPRGNNSGYQIHRRQTPNSVYASFLPSLRPLFLNLSVSLYYIYIYIQYIERRGLSGSTLFALGRPWVQLSAQKTIILTDVLRGSFQYIQANSRVYWKSGHNRLLRNLLQFIFINHSILLRYIIWEIYGAIIQTTYTQQYRSLLKFSAEPFLHPAPHVFYSCLYLFPSILRQNSEWRCTLTLQMETFWHIAASFVTTWERQNIHTLPNNTHTYSSTVSWYTEWPRRKGQYSGRS